LVGLSVIHDRKQTSAHAVHHRLHHAHHGVRGDARISRSATLFEAANTGLSGERRFRRNNAIARNHHRSRLAAVLPVAMFGPHNSGHTEEYPSAKKSHGVVLPGFSHHREKASLTAS